MAVTTTLAAIRTEMIRVVEALTPDSHRNTQFVAHRSSDLRSYALNDAHSGIMRKFQIARNATGTDPLVRGPDTTERTELATLTVAYPANLMPDDVMALEDLIRADAVAIADALFAPDNYVDGQSACFVEMSSIDKSDAVWFMQLELTILFTEAQDLSAL